MKKLLIAFLITICTMPTNCFSAEEHNFFRISGTIYEEGSTTPAIDVAIVPEGYTPQQYVTNDFISANVANTDTNGKFTIVSFPKNQNAKITAVGYKDKIIPYKQLNENMVIYVEPAIDPGLSTPCTTQELIMTDRNAKSGMLRVDKKDKQYCQIQECNDSFLPQEYEKDDTKNIRCIPCTSKIQFSVTATVKKDANDNLICIATSCRSGYDTNADGSACISTKCECGNKWDKTAKKCVPLSDAEKKCEPKSAGATAGVRACNNGREVCQITACDEPAYTLVGDTCVSNDGKPCNDEIPLPENATAGTLHNENGKMTCVATACANGFDLNRGECVAKMVLSKEDYQKEIGELSENAQKMHDKETSLANRAIGAAGIGATGIGGTMIGGALAERRADTDAERAMAAYLETFRCDYGAGRNIKGGEVNVELPGGNDMIGLYTEYAQIANDLKARKTALGIRPGIESEVVIDKAETGLYEYNSNGITGGTYASIARALMNPEGEDAKMWAAQRAATDSKLKTGAIVAGVGAVGSLAANIAVNHNNPNKVKEILDYYAPLKAPLMQAAEHANQPSPTDTSLNCSNFTATTGVGKAPDCVCKDPTNTRFIQDKGGCVPCEGGKVYNQNNECVCPSATPNNATNGCEAEPAVCPLANTLKQSIKCECVANASASDGKNCRCDDGYEEKGDTCVLKEVPPATINEPGREIAKFSFSTDALFDTGRWEIKPNKRNQLQKDLADAKQTATKENINLNTDDYCVIVVGKTDRTQYKKGSSMNNQKLSLYRANAIKNELKTVFKESNIRTYGIAETDCPATTYPMANTSTCRRVDATWLAGSCDENIHGSTNWVSNVTDAAAAASKLQDLIKK